MTTYADRETQDSSVSGDLQLSSLTEDSPYINQGRIGQMPAVINPMALVQTALEKGSDIATIEKMMDLADRYEKKEAEKQFTLAMANFKANAPTLIKDKTVSFKNNDGTFTSYKHASLAEVSSKITKAMGKWGLSHRWELDQDSEPGLIRVTCIITHAMGFSTSISMKSNPDSSGKKNGIQQVASTVSYLERYTLLAGVGLAPHDVDDDGAGDNNVSPAPTSTEEFYSDELFKKNFPEWKKLVENGTKTKSYLISFISKKAKLTEAQLEQINKIETMEQ